jgi:hypothetical protein
VIDPELLIIALVAVAGIIGTLLGTEWSGRNARELAQKQWERADDIARRNQGKDAARAILDEIIDAGLLFLGEERNRRAADMAKAGVGAAIGQPEFMLGPRKSELETHYRAIRRRAVEIADPDMASWVRHLADVLWDNLYVLEAEIADVPGVGERLEATAELVVGAYLRDEPLPALDSVPEFNEFVTTRRERMAVYQEVFEADKKGGGGEVARRRA